MNTANIAKSSQTAPLFQINKAKKVMKVTVQDILNIKPGSCCTFQCDNAGKLYSARQLVCYVKKLKMPDDIANYTTRMDWETNSISITAVAK